APGRLMSIKEIRAETSLHTATIYRRIKAGNFPAPRPIGGGRVAWLQSEIEAWKQEILSNPPI
ncbi:MAG TPA: AlpA family phage regulatory protein, partial [Novosphingobium sp.]|nr:AlpA family phage regulatory protein [Novosphingobium sp.]